MAENVTGVVIKIENDKEDDAADHKVLTIYVTEYKASIKAAQNLPNNISPKNEYTIYLHSEGNTFFVVEEKYLSTGYALLVDYRNGTDWSKNRTLLIMADSTKKIVDTAKDYKKPSADQLKLGIIVTYEQDTLSIAKIVKNLCHIKKNRKRRND